MGSTASGNTGQRQQLPVSYLVLAANVYVSEGRNDSIIQSLETLARQAPDVVLANLFVDRPYHRTGFTLTSTSPQQLAAAAARLSEAALQQVDLTTHTATHPRLGVVDHICVQPLAWPPADAGGTCARSLALDQAGACARAIGSSLARHCPVYFYGAADPARRALADVRRSLGYFKPSTQGGGATLWEGSLGLTLLDSFPPDMGSVQVSTRTGVVTIGAVPFIVNYNVPVATTDFKQAQALARAVSTRGGGLPYVEAMALHHDGCIEVACNLLDTDATPAQAVQQYLQKAAGQRYPGLEIRQGYTTGKTADELVALTLAGTAT